MISLPCASLRSVEAMPSSSYLIFQDIAACQRGYAARCRKSSRVSATIPHYGHAYYRWMDDIEARSEPGYILLQTRTLQARWPPADDSEHDITLLIEEQYVLQQSHDMGTYRQQAKLVITNLQDSLQLRTIQHKCGHYCIRREYCNEALERTPPSYCQSAFEPRFTDIDEADGVCPDRNKHPPTPGQPSMSAWSLRLGVTTTSGDGNDWHRNQNQGQT